MKQARENVDAQMAAFERLKEVKENLMDCPRWRAASDTVQTVSERVSRHYQELEDAVANRMEISRKVLKQWRAETRGLMDQLAEMSQMVAEPAMA